MSAPGDPVRIAVIGCGYQGRLHLECLRRIPHALVIAVCDRDGERVRAAADEFGVRGAYRDHAQLLEHERVDLVNICTMPDTHRQMALDALQAGAGVLCEKPMADSLTAAQAMADAARQSGLTLTVGFNLRHTTAARAVRAFVQDGSLGTPVCARGSMLETEIPWWGPHHIKRISGGGAIASTAVHMIDLLMWLAGDPEPVSATASVATLYPRKRGTISPPPRGIYDVEDLAFGHVRFATGFWMTIEGGWTWDAPGSECCIDLVGDLAQASAEPLRFSAERDGQLVDLTHEARGTFDIVDSTERELVDVVDAIRDGRAPLVTFEQALRAQAVVDALYRSAAEGREVAVGVA
jgi:predicted dehydrogenase